MEEKKVVVGKQSGRRIPRRVMVIGGMIAAVCVVAAVAFAIWLRIDTPTATTKDSTATKKTQLTVRQQASAKARTGDYEGGMKVLDTELAAQKTEQAKAASYSDKARLALNAGKNDEALAFAQNAEKLSPTRLTSKIIAVIAEYKGDTALALQYYQLTIDRYTDEEKSIGTVELEELQAKIKELSQ